MCCQAGHDIFCNVCFQTLCAVPSHCFTDCMCARESAFFVRSFAHGLCNQLQNNCVNYKFSQELHNFDTYARRAISQGLLRWKLEVHTTFENRLYNISHWQLRTLAALKTEKQNSCQHIDRKYFLWKINNCDSYNDMETKPYLEDLNNMFASMCLRSLRLKWRPELSLVNGL